MKPSPDEAPRARLQPRRGMAMVLVLILIVVLSLGTMAVFVRSSSELSTMSNLRAQTDAYTVAHAGIERYLIVTTTTPATLPNTSTYTFANGTAVVTLDRVRAAAAGGSEMFILRAVGTVTNRRTSATVPAASRTLTQIVQRQSTSLDVDAAFVALSGVNKTGVSGQVSGTDQCSAAMSALPGVAVPTGQYTSTGANSNFIDGSPDNTPSYLGLPTPGIALGPANIQVRIPWESILEGSSLQPDFTLNRSVVPNTGALPANYGNWPVVRVTGDLRPPDNNIDGQGILIVTGNADFGNVLWKGIVLVGGEATINASNEIYGSVIAGLNVKIPLLNRFPYLPQTYPGRSSVANGALKIQYNSCHVASALNRYSGWLRVANTWTDNWPTP